MTNEFIRYAQSKSDSGARQRAYWLASRREEAQEMANAWREHMVRVFDCPKQQQRLELARERSHRAACVVDAMEALYKTVHPDDARALFEILEAKEKLARAERAA
jgi:hypothetical protein